MPLDRTPKIPLLSQISLDTLLPFTRPEKFDRLGRSSKISWWQGSAGSFLTIENKALSALPTSLIYCSPDRVAHDSVRADLMPADVERLSASEWIIDGQQLSIVRKLRTPFVLKVPPYMTIPHEVEDLLRAHIGEGTGLTPEGDDVLAGFLIAARALGINHSLSPSDWNTSTTTSFSSTLLNAAHEGFAISIVEMAVRELVHSGCITTYRSELTAIGATSGTAMLRGMELAQEYVRRAA